ncbi:hypothetical protein Hanom_Chr10g00934011 [Helianthus anomalus]
MLLRITFSYKSCFVFNTLSITNRFNFKKPFKTNKVLTWWQSHKIPCMVVSYGMKFGLHGHLPFSALDSIMKRDGIYGS